MANFEIIATAAFGLEAVVAREVKKLGYEQARTENGRVLFQGDEKAICRANLWLRTAERIQIKMGEFEARTFEELFQGTRAIPWADFLPSNACFPVTGKSVKSTLFSVSDCQAIVKKAIVEKMKEKYRINWFEETGPTYKIEVALLKDVVTLTIDTSGAGLHKRGYRKLVGKAPLRETLASTMIYLSRWKAERPFIDPFCGTGTIPIEAVLQAKNIAPGLNRKFIAESWPNIPEAYWEEARTEARDVLIKDLKLDIAGYDVDNEVLSLARYHAKQAGVEQDIHFQQRPLSELQTKRKYGTIICNPPYGERMEDEETVIRLYKEMGTVINKLDTWSYYILTAYPGFEKYFGRKSDKNRKLYNGIIKVYYYQYFGPKPK